MNMENDKELEELIIESANKRIRIKQLEELRIELAKEFDNKRGIFSPLTTNLMGYEKSTEKFITNIMGRLVKVQNELTSSRESLANIEERIDELRGISQINSDDERDEDNIR